MLASPAAIVTVDPVDIASVMPTLAPLALPTTRDLLLQALLHLPRLARRDGTIDVPAALAEIERLRAERAVELGPLRAIAEPPPHVPSLGDLEVRPVPATAAAEILRHFHYLRSPRPDAVTIAAMYGTRIAALCSISPLDLAYVEDELPIPDAAVVSRVFAFDWAPRNVVSYLLARAERMVDARVLVTYLNPNMGFTGASYKASNWVPLGIETGTRYAYLDWRYVTDRELARMPAPDLTRVGYSRMPLRPLVLMCRFLDRRLQRAYPDGFSHVFERPAPPLAA